MNRLLHFAFLALITLVLIPRDGGATHIMGGNITYNCVGQDSFLVRISLYRDCSPGSATLGNTASLSLEAPGCTTMTVTATLISGSGNDITPLCAGWPSPCGGSSSQLPLGVEEYIYEVLVVLPPNTNCNYTLSWSSCCRNSDITTGANDESFYIFTELNRNVRPCNQSPQFENVPVPFICTGLPFSYNHGVTDADGDSLVFSLVPCRTTNKTSSVTYNPGLSAVQPLETNGPVLIDPQTGSITFTPSISQIGVICVRAEEYDRASKQKIGEVTRDIQIVVTNCNNEPPEASPINGTQDYDTAICPGQGVAFDIYSNDSTPFQSVTMSWNGGIPGATFNISGGQYPTGSFSWNPGVADIGFHFFTVTVIDDGCPIRSQQTFAYSVEVRNPIIDLGPDLTVCDGDTVQGVVPFESVDFTSYTWTPGNIIGPTNTARPLFSPGSATTYVVEATNGFCTDRDTITVNVDSKPEITTSGDQTICEGDSIELTASGDPATYEWSTNQQGPSITVSPGATTTYQVTATSTLGCESDTTLTVMVNPLPVVDAGADASICEGEQHILSATGDGSQFSWSPPGQVVDPDQASTASLATSTTVFTVTNTDVNGCSSSDTVRLSVHPNPSIGAYPDTAINLGDVVVLSSGNPNASTYQWSPDVGLQSGSSVTDPQISVSPSETTTYTVEITDANGCQSTDTVLVQLIPGNVSIPNAFTPNGDGLNDELYLLGSGLTKIETFKVFNRWGQVIFEGNQAGKGNGWDGTFKGEEQPAGVYTYMYIEIDPDTDEPRDPISGNVTLIR